MKKHIKSKNSGSVNWLCIYSNEFSFEAIPGNIIVTFLRKNSPPLFKLPLV